MNMTKCKFVLNVEIWMLRAENIAEEPTLSEQIQILSKHSICIGGSQMEEIKQQNQQITSMHHTNAAFKAPCLDWSRLVILIKIFNQSLIRLFSYNQVFCPSLRLSMLETEPGNLLWGNNYMSKCIFKPTHSNY